MPFYRHKHVILGDRLVVACLTQVVKLCSCQLSLLPSTGQGHRSCVSMGSDSAADVVSLVHANQLPVCQSQNCNTPQSQVSLCELCYKGF